MAELREAVERLRKRAWEQRRFTDDDGCTHDAAPSQHQLDLRAVLPKWTKTPPSEPGDYLADVGGVLSLCRVYIDEHLSDRLSAKWATGSGEWSHGVDLISLVAVDRWARIPAPLEADRG